MKRFILMSIIILLFTSAAQAAPQTQSFAPANVKVFIDDKQIFFDEEPVIVNSNTLLPLRKIAESLLLGTGVSSSGQYCQTTTKPPIC